MYYNKPNNGGGYGIDTMAPDRACIDKRAALHRRRKCININMICGDSVVQDRTRSPRTNWRNTTKKHLKTVS